MSGHAEATPLLGLGLLVTIRDENDRPVRGVVVAYGQANDGTGRYGYSVRVTPDDGPESTYWRARAEVWKVRP
jgi:protocatechuate 3,4-dioxygenase beta subunit